MSQIAKQFGVRLLRQLVPLAVFIPCVAVADQPQIYKVEEDWKLVVAEPQVAIHSPQLTLYTTPEKSRPLTYFQLQLNHAAREDFLGGGFMVSAVREDEVAEEARSDFRSPFTHDGELIKWTTVMAVLDGELLYAVKDGHGSAWGTFGGPEYIVRMPAGNSTSLAKYSPLQSLETVDFGFGGNRVKSLTLEKVRVYYTDGKWSETVLNKSP